MASQLLIARPATRMRRTPYHSNMPTAGKHPHCIPAFVVSLPHRYPSCRTLISPMHKPPTAHAPTRTSSASDCSPSAHASSAGHRTYANKYDMVVHIHDAATQAQVVLAKQRNQRRQTSHACIASSVHNNRHSLAYPETTQQYNDTQRHNSIRHIAAQQRLPQSSPSSPETCP